VGGWDTTIRRTQYEKLFYSQQSSMTDVDYGVYSRQTEDTDTRRVESGAREKRLATHVREEQVKYESKVKASTETVAVPAITPQQVQSQKPALSEDELKLKLESLVVDSTVIHKKFGEGKVIKFNRGEKFVYVKFWGGEKKFIYPDAFLMGFLEMG
jgi:hypothetical protein